MSSHSNMSKFEKEKQKLIQEKCQTLLNDMLRDEDNKYCVDCDAKGPRWASWNLGIFLCIRCAGIHRNLGVHISRVKSVNLDSWTPEQVVTMQNMGNSRARALYEANMPDTLRRPQTDSTLESFIRAKYEHKKYIAKEWVQPPPVKVNWDSEIEESMRKSKEVKKSGNVTDIGPIPTPTGVSKQIKSIPTPAAKPPPVIDVSKVVASQAQAANPTSNGHSLVSTSASEDLLGLTTDTSSFITTGNIISTHEVSKNTSTSTNSGDDLGSIFLSPSSSVSTDLGKMSKESILSLYGSASTPTTPNINPFIQPGAGGSPFGNPNLQGPGGPGAGQNLAQTGGYGYNYMNTNFLGQATPHSVSQQQSLGPHAGAGVPGGFGNQAQRNDTAQVQNQLFGLNLGNQSQVPFPNPGGNPMNSSFMTQQQQITQMGGNNVPLNTPYLANPIYPPTKPDNLPGLGNSVSQLMQPNLSGSSFWK